MPHVPYFPSEDEEREEERLRDRRSIIDRIIGGGDAPTPTGG